MDMRGIAGAQVPQAPVLAIRRRMVAAVLAVAALAWLAPLVQAQDGAAAPGRILKIFSVGGVLTADGTLWQYTPQQNWRTIDEAFREQGKETHILPLPVPAESIADMVTFGFLLTTAGDTWLYDLESDQWNRLAAPR